MVLASPRLGAGVPVPAHSNEPGTHITHGIRRTECPHLVGPPHSLICTMTTMRTPCKPTHDARNTSLPSLVNRLSFLTINPHGLEPRLIQEPHQRTTHDVILDILMNADGRSRTLVRDAPNIRQDTKGPWLPGSDSRTPSDSSRGSSADRATCHAGKQKRPKVHRSLHYP